ncbi:hypothetical protein [Clostridium beijerinckii]|uniref:Uncharacterized protein n=1 Tax=Clostridium beijerinckii TaxID=1520 RepID=A0A1S8SBY0_CLOBE|nr:hypothetical protein [Clostridium beijerinckii]NRY61870.1 membrane protein involved in colicin uptake [Clostridium beijerinckii]OOM62957.1 hypothetical protein CLBCK_14260 [Clostridium beijerinckii]
MDILDKKILEFIKKSGRRIKLNFIINKVLMGLQASLVLVAIILMIALFIPFENCYKASGLVISVALIISGAFGIMKAPDNKKIALIADSKGLDERVTTALELIGDNGEIAIAQKEDTIKIIQAYDFKKNLPIGVDKKELYKILVLTVVCFGIIIVPTSAKKEAENLRKFNEIKSEISKKIDKEEKKIQKEDKLSNEEKEELKKILEETKKELKETKRQEDTDKLMDRLEKKFDSQKEKAESEKGKELVEELKKNLTEQRKNEKKREALKNLNEINNSLSKNKLGKEIMDTMKNGDKQALEDKLKELNKSLEKLSDKDKSELSNSLAQAAANLSDEELKELLQKASDNVLDGEIDASELADALASLNNNSNGGSNPAKGNGSNLGNGSSSGSGAGNGSGSGTGGSGSGSGSGAGNGGGWNTGSKSGKENTSSPRSGEQVFIPGREVGSDANLKGNKNNSGTSQSIETQSGLNIGGEKKDYNSIIGDYSKEEIDSMNNSSLPENLQDVVKEYFNNIK